MVEFDTSHLITVSQTPKIILLIILRKFSILPNPGKAKVGYCENTKYSDFLVKSIKIYQ